MWGYSLNVLNYANYVHDTLCRDDRAGMQVDPYDLSNLYKVYKQRGTISNLECKCNAGKSNNIYRINDNSADYVHIQVCHIDHRSGR